MPSSSGGSTYDSERSTATPSSTRTESTGASPNFGKNTVITSSQATNTIAEYSITVTRFIRVNETNWAISLGRSWRSLANVGNAMSTTTFEIIRTGSSTTS